MALVLAASVHATVAPHAAAATLLPSTAPSTSARRHVTEIDTPSLCMAAEGNDHGYQHNGDRDNGNVADGEGLSPFFTLIPSFTLSLRVAPTVGSDVTCAGHRRGCTAADFIV